jgi:O-antigen/teichoic acid export membrane protein
MTLDPTPVVLNGHVLRNSLSNYIGKFVSLGTWFLLTPFLLSRLEASTYGLWVLVGSVVAYGSLFDFGIAAAITKYTAEYHAKGEYQEARELIATALSLYTILGIIVCAISLLIASSAARFFNVPEAQRSLTSSLVVVSGLGVGLSIPSAATSAILRGLQRFDLINLVTIAGTLLSAGAMVATLLLGGTVLGLAAVNVVMILTMQVPSVWLIHRIAPELRVGWLGARRRAVRKVAAFSSSLFIINLNGYLETKTDEIVIGANMPVSAVAPYNLALKLSSLPQALTAQFLSQILPIASTLDARNSRADLRLLYIMSTRLTLALFLPVGAMIMLFAASILRLWVGVAYSGYAYLVVILALASLIDTSTWPAGLILQGMARHVLLAVMSLLSGLANLGLSLILVQSLGLAGVALGTLIPTTLMTLLFVVPYSMRLIGVSAREAIMKIYLPAFMPVIPMVLVSLVCARLLGVASFAALAVTAGIGTATYGLIYLALDTNSPERQAVLTLWTRSIRYVTGALIKLS